MSNLRQAAQQALEALVLWEDEAPHAWSKADEEAVAALRAALAEPEQEPVAWMSNKDFNPIRVRIMCEAYDLADRGDSEGYNAIKVMCGDVQRMLPPQRKPLTDAEIWNTYKNLWMFHPAEEPRLAGDVLKFARAIERKHGIGEQHE